MANQPSVCSNRDSSPPDTPFIIDEGFDRMLGAAVALRIGLARFNLWFKEHAHFHARPGEVLVVARSAACRDWLQQTFGEAVAAAAEEVCPGQRAIRWLLQPAVHPEAVESAKHNGSRPKSRNSPTSAQVSEKDVDLFGDPVAAPKKKKSDRHESELDSLDETSAAHRAGRRWKSLGDFVVGPGNRVAHASALSAVEEPALGANPLVFHGPVGTGKTHLLEGIFAGLKRGGERTCFVTAEEFTTRFVQASRLGKMGSFRRQFRDCSALLLDNLNFLATKKATQEEFLHTLDSLVSSGRQVVVTTDCHPRLADELMPELVDRLLGGAVWSLLPPDCPTRLAILRKKSLCGLPAIPDAMLQSLASGLRGNVRELEGAVNSLRHFAKVTGRPIDQALVREALGELLRHAVRVVSVADIDAAVCAVLHLSAGSLQSKARSWAVTHPRMVAIYLCRKHTAATYGEISYHFGAKTHSTSVAAEKKVRGWLDADASVAIGDRHWPVRELIDRVEHEMQR